MNKEEKARAYDEALNWMRSIYPNLSGADKEDAEHFFHELRESEDESHDERIRKCIGLALTDVEEQRFMDYNTSLKDCLSWLKKQKHLYETTKDRFYSEGFEEGQLYERRKECLADNSKTSTSEDERIRKFLVDYFASYKIGNVTTKLNGVRIDDILAYLDKQKAQKQEWSEEDEMFAYFVNQFLEYHESSDPTAKSCKKMV